MHLGAVLLIYPLGRQGKVWETTLDRFHARWIPVRLGARRCFRCSGAIVDAIEWRTILNTGYKDLDSEDRGIVMFELIGIDLPWIDYRHGFPPYLNCDVKMNVSLVILAAVARFCDPLASDSGRMPGSACELTGGNLCQFWM